MADEIERKFLITDLPGSLELGPGQEVRQGYLAIDGPVEVRLRWTGPDAVITVKAGAGVSRTEVELPVETADAEALWPHTDGRRVEKVRHRVALEGRLHADVDRYLGDLSGLCTAEVEFDEMAQSRSFEPPPWFGRELTGVRGWSNADLARHGLPESTTPRDEP